MAVMLQGQIGVIAPKIPNIFLIIGPRSLECENNFMEIIASESLQVSNFTFGSYLKVAFGHHIKKA